MLVHLLEVFDQGVAAALTRPLCPQHHVDVLPYIAEVLPGILKYSVGVSVIVDAAGVLAMVEWVTLGLDKARVSNEELSIVAAISVQELEQVEPAAAALRVTEGEGHEVVAASKQEHLRGDIGRLDVSVKRLSNDDAVVLVAANELCQCG